MINVCVILIAGSVTGIIVGCLMMCWIMRNVFSKMMMVIDDE